MIKTHIWINISGNGICRLILFDKYTKNQNIREQAGSLYLQAVDIKIEFQSIQNTLSGISCVLYIAHKKNGSKTKSHPRLIIIDLYVNSELF